MPKIYLNRKYIIVATILLLSVGNLTAQIGLRNKNETPPLIDRMIYGGSFGLQFGTYTNIEVSPIVGLWLLPRVGVAAGPIYKYIKDPIGATGVYGGRAFVRLMLINNFDNIIPLGLQMGLFSHLEYEQLSYRSDFFYSSYESSRISNMAILGGFGISQYMGPKSSLNISLLWQLNETELDIYDSTIFKFGITF